MTIIEKTMILEVPRSWNIGIAVILCGTFALIALVSIIYSWKKFSDLDHAVSVIAISGFVSVILAMILSCNMMSLFGKPTGRYKYKVLIDDKVSINDIYNNYDNITYDGTYYYFEDKNKED